ncbi:MAG: Na+/H+ antiporter NhaA, partial [Atopobiaceae bacterium]|nr:Na+/H+ antiporter NhaA [Atopobiaceae bacterium]
GVAVPAVIYLLFNQGPLADGWAIPIATDIAFALGIMSLLGRRISSATKVFFQTLAIADDILAIIVLALFYGTSLDIFWLAASVLATLALFLLNKASVYNVRWYAVVGSVLWVCMFDSGIHATLAGVIIAFALPAKSDIRLSSLSGWLNSQARRLEDSFDDESHVLGQHDFTHAATNVERIMHHVTPPLQRVEHNISVFVNFFVLPLFAFVNAQVRLVGVDMATIVSDPVAQGSFLGAVVGKPIGIILVTFVLVQIGFAKLPNRVTWDQIIAVGLLGGIGFTMSILISGLAFRSAAEVLAAKCAILAGSVAASAIGCAYVMLFGSRDKDGNPKQKPSE